MENINIIFDTNVYRVLTYGSDSNKVIERFEHIKQEEKARKITGVLTAVTAMELLSHLTTDDDPGFDNCKLAIIAAGIHATDEYLLFIPHITLHLQKLILGEVDPVDTRGNKNIAHLVNKISSSDPEKTIIQYN